MQLLVNFTFSWRCILYPWQLQGKLEGERDAYDIEKNVSATSKMQPKNNDKGKPF